jgi:hypothetical protein
MFSPNPDVILSEASPPLRGGVEGPAPPGALIALRSRARFSHVRAKRARYFRYEDSHQRFL